eukprot:Seg1838.6 transcript_id=Seg1838.6/GoldUCD/mRNA.D3Y31 product="hypothetical protein" protein_id=Seg1838.6/GoldUCD/D3Y31
MANAKTDHKHLSDLKEEEKFLLRMQFKLQRQQKLLKVEEAALLKLMSGNANGPNTNKGSKFPLSTTSLPAAQGTTISGQVQMNDNNFLQDTAVNTAPLRLDNFTVQATQNSLEVDDVQQGSDLALQVHMDSLSGNECLTSPMEEEDENISEHDDDDE